MAGLTSEFSYFSLQAFLDSSLSLQASSPLPSVPGACFSVPLACPLLLLGQWSPFQRRQLFAMWCISAEISQGSRPYFIGVVRYAGCALWAQAEVSRLGASPGSFLNSTPVSICFPFLLISPCLEPLCLAYFLPRADLGDLPARVWGAVFFLTVCLLNKGQGYSHFRRLNDIIILCFRIKYKPPLIFNLPPHPFQAYWVEMSLV